MKKHPHFHFELKRQAKNWQGDVIIDSGHISPRTVEESIFLDADKQYPPRPPPFPNEGLRYALCRYDILNKLSEKTNHFVYSYTICLGRGKLSFEPSWRSG